MLLGCEILQFQSKELYCATENELHFAIAICHVKILLTCMKKKKEVSLIFSKDFFVFTNHCISVKLSIPKVLSQITA